MEARQKISRWLDSALSPSLGRLFLSAVVVALLAGVSFLILDVNRESVGGTSQPATSVRLIENAASLPTPEQAHSEFLRQSATTGYSASRQPSDPYWLGVTLRGQGVQGDSHVLEFRMLRASHMEFWAFDADNPSSEPVQLAAKNEKGGIAVRLSLRPNQRIDVLGRIDPLGVARPKVFLWNEPDFQDSELLFERGGGALLGSFLMLAFFSAFVGIINRDWSFFLFSGWLITSLRLASINDGWDFIWLGVYLDQATLSVILRVTLAAYALLTGALFRSLLGTELKGSRLDQLLIFANSVLGIIVIAAAFLPHSILLPLLWTTSALGLVLLTTSLGYIVRRTRSTVSLWYAASWGLSFLGVLSEIGYASGLIPVSLVGINSQTASIASALVTAVALSEKLRVERNEKLKAQRETFEALEKFRANYQSMPIGLFSMDRDGQISLYNPSFAAMFALSRWNVVNPPLSVADVLGASALQTLTSAAQTVGGGEVELRLASEAHDDRWFLARVATKGESIEGSIQEITARKEAENKLRHLVDHDPLTGLLNRRGLEEALNAASNAAAALVSCAIAHIDLDRFKLVNDLYGHAIGDAMLIEAAARLKGTVRGRDQIARIADSFVVVFQDCPDHAVVRLTERLRQAIGEHPFEIHGKALNMTVSVGVVPMEPQMSPVDAMTSADHACAEAKARGRNCVVRLSEKDAVLRSHLEELRVVADLQQRISMERYFLEFQPIVSLRAPHSALSYEVLLRMRDEAGLVIPPSRFIGAAERNGLMSQIDRWVLRSTLEWLDQHPEHRERLTYATINLSGASLNDVRFVDDAFAMMHDHPQAVTKLCFEITESVALNDLASTRRFVDRVRTFGSRLALDDFGAGYTSFNYLKEIPAEFIKIDGSFVRDINRNPANYAITRTIVDLTHELGMSSIAEWAETADTIASLLELSVDYAQGFSLARPMPKELLAEAHSCGSLVLDRQVLAIIENNIHPAVNLHPGHRRI